jgi:hypothetical protein
MTTTIGGAIRWDYQYQGPGGAPLASNNVLELQALETADFRNRAPKHFASIGPNLGQWADSQSTFDAEIAAAVSAGLKYWAFFRQSLGTAVHDSHGIFGFTYYQASTKNNLINWCSIFDIAQLGSTGNYSTQVAAMVADFQTPNYQMVLANRPLVYLYWLSASLASNWGASLANFAAMITALRTACTSAGLGSPYVVVMNGLDVTVFNGIGADAISNYNAPASFTLATPWATYEPTVEAYWASLAALGKPIIPIAMTGWDQRPRFVRPIVKNASFQPYFKMNQYIVAPTNPQLTAHIAAAIAYISANPSACPAATLLIYAWNEHSENGNVLNPCVGDPTGTRCAAVGSALIGN